jgi:ATP synthase protein I
MAPPCVSFTIPYCTGSITGHGRLDNFILILLELAARHRQSPCVLAALHSPTWVRMPPSQDPLYAGLGQAVRIGTDLLAALIVGGGLGWVCDTYLFDSTPWAMVGGLVLGVVTGIRNAYRSAQRWPKT